ncbi:hypothetical protein L6452_00865 [Arctium lappa]|uniref:Uncharacterized protein n=1 Tax=Arctium lappa TaxID=4217 RepID=A0ACB9FGI7_ARCLA|nr:hypothetical protein L6452_00865 [Arctium lappa]
MEVWWCLLQYMKAVVGKRLEQRWWWWAEGGVVVTVCDGVGGGGSGNGGDMLRRWWLGGIELGLFPSSSSLSLIWMSVWSPCFLFETVKSTMNFRGKFRR